MIIFIVPAYNSKATISKCIESILKQNLDIEKEIFVVDNNSNDETPTIIKQYPVKYIFEEKKSPAAARNKGLKTIKQLGKRPEFVAFVDSDAVLPYDWAKKGINLLKKYEKKYETIAGVGGPAKSVDKNLITEMLDCLFYGIISSNNEKFVKSLPTMNLIYRYKYIEDMYFDENFIFAAGEDVDFNFRLIKKGFKLLYSKDLLVYHHHPTKISKIVKKWFSYGKYYPLPYFKNKELLHVSLWLRLLYLPVIFLTSLIGVFFQNFLYLYLIILVLPFAYLILGIKARIKNILKLLFFVYIHTIKQWAQILGIYVGMAQKFFQKIGLKYIIKLMNIL